MAKISSRWASEIGTEGSPPAAPVMSASVAGLDVPVSSLTAMPESCSSQPWRSTSGDATWADLGPLGHQAQLLEGGLDVDPALGERPQDGSGDVGELSQAVAPDVPGQSERGQ